MADNDPSKGGSASALLSSLIPLGLYAGIYFALFLIFRNKFKRFYSPRTFLGSLRPDERTPAPKSGLFNWFGDYFSLADSYVLNHHSLDGFLLLRLLKVSVIICLVGCAITWPVLFPVDATGGGSANQLNVLNMSHINNSHKFFQYFAHVGCAYLFFGFVLYMITRESIYYINLRQAYLISEAYAERMSSRTVLFTSVPDEYLIEANLRRMLGPSVVRVWFASNTKELDDLVETRDKIAYRLEGAETKLIKTANGKHIKEIKAARKEASKRSTSTDGAPLTDTQQDVESGSASKYLTQKDRPTHRLKPLIGKKVDTIDWCRAELVSLVPRTVELQNKHKNHDAEKQGAAFVEFANMREAQAAYQSLAHHQALHMSPRFTGVTPGEIIWSNLRIKWWERVIRGFAVLAVVIALIVFWSVITTFIGAISNVQALAHSGKSYFAWLSFFDDIPPVVRGVVTGLLPVILLAVVMALLPVILRLLAKLSGDVTLSQVELTVQNYYFAFQIINVFLFTTIGSSAASAIGQIAANPSGIPTLLATSLPKASNFYLSYFIIQGLAVVASKLLRVVGLIVFIALAKLLDNTPRKMYKRWYNLSSIGWGTLVPIYTNLLVIGLCYAIIAPLVLGFAAIGLYFFYLAHRYDLLFVSNATIDTQGRLYPRALMHLFIGLYVAQACLIGLFVIAVASGSRGVGAIGPLILMILFLIFTVLYHLSLSSALKPLIDFLPKSLVAQENLAERTDSVEKGRDDYGEQPVETIVLDRSAPHKKPSMLTKFLKPHIYNDFATMQRLVAQRVAPTPVPQADATNAYFNPSITSEVPRLWIPRDPLGISRQEVADSSKVIPITDEHARLDDNNKIVYDYEDAEQLPVYQKRLDY